ncbi:cytochrome c [Rhizobium sp. R693]|uniref:cytochrome c n=1 Tax=Rhizobium sp. R693 TaxID=1764276 RepID=UPI000B533369|nr:cytochrome c [Rhizobium sp. R693]
MNAKFLVCSVIFGTVASAAVCAKDVVTARQADMKAMAAATKSIAGMFKEPSTYRPVEFKHSADLIGDKAGRVLIDHFAREAATSSDSKAKPNIIDERERFDRLANDLKSYAGALAAAAENNPTTMTDSMRMKPGEAMGGGPLGTHVRSEEQLSSIPAEHAFHLMLQTCTTCHSRYRME